jgi:hypothetical protein
MSGQLRTTTLTFGPFPKPLSPNDVAILARAAAKAIGQGFVVARMETDHTVTVHAVITAPITQPFHRAPSLGEATATQES